MPHRAVLGARWPGPHREHRDGQRRFPGPYTLLSVAAIVLGGVSLAGGRGGVFGPLIGVVILQLIRTDMTFMKLDPNLATVAQGVILIGVVMLGSLLQRRRSRRERSRRTADARNPG